MEWGDASYIRTIIMQPFFLIPLIPHSVAVAQCVQDGSTRIRLWLWLVVVIGNRCCTDGSDNMKKGVRYTQTIVYRREQGVRVQILCNEKGRSKWLSVVLQRVQ